MINTNVANMVVKKLHKYLHNICNAANVIFVPILRYMQINRNRGIYFFATVANLWQIDNFASLQIRANLANTEFATNLRMNLHRCKPIFSSCFCRLVTI